MQFRRLRGLPGIVPKVGGHNLRHQFGAHLEQRPDIQVQMHGPIRREVFHAEFEEAHRGPQPGPMFGVLRMEILLLKVDESAGNLDSPLKKR